MLYSRHIYKKVLTPISFPTAKEHDSRQHLGKYICKDQGMSILKPALQHHTGLLSIILADTPSAVWIPIPPVLAMWGLENPQHHRDLSVDFHSV